MKLYDGKYILPAVAVFLAVAIFPVWRATGGRGPGFRSPPNPNGERCIEPKDFMRAEHMRMLVRWRDQAVRENSRVYVAADGRRWEKGLETCVACHGHADARGKSTTAAAACSECHGYVDAKLDCWDCHHESAEPNPAVARLGTGPASASGAKVCLGTSGAPGKGDL